MPTNTIDLTGMTAVGYIRVSTEAQAGEKQTSLADQRAALAVLAARLGVTVGHVFEDAGLSGATIEYRPGMLALIASCEASPRRGRDVGHVLILNDSRWGRFERSEESTYWRVHLEKRGWRVRFAEHDDVDDDTVRPVLRAIVASQASLYRTTLKANVRRGTKGQAEQGYWQGMAPFGYARQVVHPADRARVLANGVPKAPDEKVILTPRAEEAAIIQMIYSRYTEHRESLASLLTWSEHVYPSRVWTRSALLRLLTNPVYVGDVVWGRVSVEPGRRAVRPDAEWYGKRDAHAAIVTRAVFDAAQQRINSNRRHKRAVRGDWVLSGLVRCRCGRSFVGSGQTGFGKVYACSSRGASQGRRCAYPGAVLQRLLEGSVIDVLAEELGSAVHREAMADAIDTALAESTRSTRTVDAIQREIEAVEQKQRRLMLAIEDEAITSAEATPRMRALRADGDRLRLEAAALRSAASPAAERGWRNQLVAQALDFRQMATILTGPALRDLIQLWLKRAEFNTETRELTMEIRRVPADSAYCSGGRALLNNMRGHDATVTRKVIVGRRVA